MDTTFFTSSTTPYNNKETQYLFNSNNTNKHHQYHHHINITTTNDHDHDHDQYYAAIDHMQATNHLPLPAPPAAAATSTSLSSDSAVAAGAASEPCPSSSAGKWASRLLKECAKAISDKDSSKIHHLLWMLNELASPYGDCDQKLASYFLQALFCKATDSGLRCYKTLTSVADRSRSFDSARKLILKFQEVSPWTTFGHVASNGAILEALDGETKLHIIDLSNTLCTQWPTLLEALATRSSDETPRLRLTVVSAAASAGAGSTVMKEIRQRMEKFARLMGVPFEFHMVSESSEITRQGLGIQDDEAVAVNCVGALRRAGVAEREAAIGAFRSLKPRVVTVVEEEADFTTTREDFVSCFEECLRFYMLYFEMLEESFSATSNEKLMLERECSRGIVRVLACEELEEVHDHDHDPQEHNVAEMVDNGAKFQYGWGSQRREKGEQWSQRMERQGFNTVGYSDDVLDDVKALLKRYPPGWGLVLPPPDHDQTQQQQQQHHHHHLQGVGVGVGGERHQGQHERQSSGTSSGSGIYLTWKEEPVVWASAWKP